MKQHPAMNFPPARTEHPSTYFVQDRASQEEVQRLQTQEQFVTAGMGGVLPEQPDPSRFQRVLDVGCGTGGWLIAVAKISPQVSRLVGVDISDTMLAFAREQATRHGVGERIEFLAMDALRMLEFPAGFFDLVNHRFGQSWLRTWEWAKLLQEYQRVTRPGGVIRLTETDAWEGNSPALLLLTDVAVKAAYHAGHLFAQRRDGLTSQLARLMELHGIEQVQTCAYALTYRAGTPEGQHFTEVIRLGYRTGEPFLRKWTRVPEDYPALCQQMLDEMQRPGFVVTLGLLTAWGIRPAVPLGTGTTAIWTDR